VIPLDGRVLGTAVHVLASLCKKFEVALVIFVTEKGRLSSIATLSDVLGKTGCDDAS
jgi:hypothetical protein